METLPTLPILVLTHAPVMLPARMKTCARSRLSTWNRLFRYASLMSFMNARSVAVFIPILSSTFRSSLINVATVSAGDYFGTCA